jgi:hypothetical protein
MSDNNTNIDPDTVRTIDPNTRFDDVLHVPDDLVPSKPFDPTFNFGNRPAMGETR